MAKRSKKKNSNQLYTAPLALARDIKACMTEPKIHSFIGDIQYSDDGNFPCDFCDGMGGFEICQSIISQSYAELNLPAPNANDPNLDKYLHKAEQAGINYCWRSGAFFDIEKPVLEKLHAVDRNFVANPEDMDEYRQLIYTLTAKRIQCAYLWSQNKVLYSFSHELETILETQMTFEEEIPIDVLNNLPYPNMYFIQTCTFSYRLKMT